MKLISRVKIAVQSRFGRFDFIPGVPTEVPDDYGELLLKSNPGNYREFREDVDGNRSEKLVVMYKQIETQRKNIDKLKADLVETEATLQKLVVEAEEETKRIEGLYSKEKEIEVKKASEVIGTGNSEYTKSKLMRMKKDDLLQIVAVRGLELEGTETNEQIIEKILDTQ